MTDSRHPCWSRWSWRAQREQGRAAGAGARGAWTRVGLVRRNVGERYPHQLSGGQKQRVVIARALTLRAETDRLRRGGRGARHVDPRRRAQSLRRIAARPRRTYVFITHDLAVVSPYQRAHRGDVSRPFPSSSARPKHVPNGRCIPIRQALLSAEPLSVALDRSRRPAHRAAKARSEPDRSTIRLPLPHRCRYAQALCADRNARLARARARFTGWPCHFAGQPNFRRTKRRDTPEEDAR